MASDFRGSNIIVRASSSMWGPFEFDFSETLPNGCKLANCNITSWQKGTETTKYLVEPSSVITLGARVSIRLKCPKDTDGNAIYKGNHILLFHIKADNGALHTIRFEYVSVEAEYEYEYEY